MTDPQRMEKVELWARFVKERPDKWREQLNPFIDAQIIKAHAFYARLAQMPKGKKKIEEIKRLRANRK